MRTTVQRLRRTVAALLVGVQLAVVALAGCDGGGSSAPSSSKSGGDDGYLSVAYVPKARGISYHDAMNEGGKVTGYDNGFRWIYKPPRTTQPADQAAVIRGLIAKRVDVLAVAPSDPEQVAPVLRQARRRGIEVVTVDTDVPRSRRNVYASQVRPQAMGQALTTQLMQAAGRKTKYAIVSCDRESPNLNAWIAAQRAYTKAKYPKAELVDVVHTDGDAMAATSLARRLMDEHPKLTGLVGECASAATGVAKAVRDTDRIGKVRTVGVGTPKAMAPYLGDGSSSASVIWDAKQFGSLVAWAGMRVNEGTKFDRTNEVNQNLTDVRYYAEERTLVLGDPLVLTVENVSDYDF